MRVCICVCESMFMHRRMFVIAHKSPHLCFNECVAMYVHGNAQEYLCVSECCHACEVRGKVIPISIFISSVLQGKYEEAAKQTH